MNTQKWNSFGKFEALYFPVCLLKGFEKDTQGTAKKILAYCFQTYQKSQIEQYGKEQAIKNTFENIGSCEVVNYEIVPMSAQTWASHKNLRSYADGFQLDEDEKALFLYVCAVRSVLGRNDFSKTNWKLLANRMAGNTKPILEKKDFTGIPKRFVNRSKEFVDRCLTGAAGIFGINYYSSKSMHGFYVSQKITIYDLIDAVKATYKDYEKKAERAKEASKKIDDNTARELVKSFADHLGYEFDEDMFLYAKSNYFWADKSNGIIKGLQYYTKNKKKPENA